MSDSPQGKPQSGPKIPAPARPASTAAILRDGPGGIEVFMVVRHHEIDFASGALVFPGGKVEAEDAGDGWADLAAETPAAPERPFFVAAGRETFEEAGLVLARRRGTAELVDAANADRLVAAHRARLPVFAFQTSQVRDGASLVVGRDYRDSGRQAAALAARVMRGEQPGAIPFQAVTRTRVIVNLEAARRAGLTIPHTIVERAAEVVGR